MAETTDAPQPMKDKLIIENADLQEFFKIMRDNSQTANDLIAVVREIGAMEKYLESAVNELSTIRLQLAEMQEKNDPLQNLLSNAANATQKQVLSIRDSLTELKNNFVACCKNAADAFKETGISALDNVAKFFNIKPTLEALRDNLDKGIQLNDKVITKIETASTEYHEASKHIKNIGRALIGKEPIQEAKPIGKVAKALTAPYRAENARLTAMKGCTVKAINSLSRLEERAEKPSITGTIQKYAEQIAQAKTETPAPTVALPPQSHADR